MTQPPTTTAELAPPASPLPDPAAAATIALVGNPNTGKSALFNRLTGARQRVGNYPGLTVEKKVGLLKLDDERAAEVIDLPGLYSLAAISLDEQVVLNALAGRVEGVPRPDLIVLVADMSHLNRHLFLASQLAELDLPIVIAANMSDEARDRGIEVDLDTLSQRLGVPVVATAANRGDGLPDLRRVIDRALQDRPLMARVEWPQPVQDAHEELANAVHALSGQELHPAEITRLLFDTDGRVTERIHWDPVRGSAAVDQARSRLRDAGLEPSHAEATLRYEWIHRVLEGLVRRPEQPRPEPSESIDRLLTHRVFGLVVFVGIMYVVFRSIYAWAGPFMDAIEAGFGYVSGVAGAALVGMPMLQSLVCDGMIAGVGGVVVFLPQILILFFFIALLEDTGYMARAAFLMDKLFSWCGLNGKSFVPMLSSYACAIPGLMATRGIEDPKARLTTILVAPLMSCSARLPVYVLLIGAFIEPATGPAWAAAVLLGMHFVGLGVSIPVAMAINRWMLKGKPVPFVLEMPPYRLPSMRDVAWRMYERGREFVIRAGTVIFAMSIIIWALCYFPRPASVEQQTTADYAQQVAGTWDLPTDHVRNLMEDEAARDELALSRAVDQVGASLNVNSERASEMVQAAQSISEDQEDPAEALAQQPAFQTGTDSSVAAETRATATLHSVEEMDQRVAEAFALQPARLVESAYLEQSFMGRLGKLCQPIFAPAGFDWKITVGVLSSFPAREVIISTLGIIYHVGADADEESSSLKQSMQNDTWANGAAVYTPVVAVAIMVFFALCAQCVSTLVVMAREANWGWAVFSFVYMTVLAWIGAVAVYQLGRVLLPGVA